MTPKPSGTGASSLRLPARELPEKVFRLSSLLTATPLQEMKWLGKHLGCQARLFVKRDDLTPFGGGKFRKAAVLVDRAAQAGATVVVTEGAVESRHARATAVAARMLGLRCALVVSPERDLENSGPTLLDEPEGAEIVRVDSENDRPEACKRCFEALQAAGERVVVIPFSGSTPETALAYSYAFDELLAQLVEFDEMPCEIFVSSATGGIQAGLQLGKARRSAVSVNIIGVSPGFPAGQVRAQVAGLASEAASLLGEPLTLAASEICVLDGYAASGYLNTTPEARSATALAKELENLDLDPIYTAKTFAAMLDQVRGKPDRRTATVFWHTAG